MLMMLLPWILLAGALGAIGASLLRGRHPRRHDRPPRGRDRDPRGDDAGRERTPIWLHADDDRSQAVAVPIPVVAIR
ncbi:MAG: hypothetical protein ACYCVZ_17565 [Streptosporangiaceae bacterium]